MIPCNEVLNIVIPYCYKGTI